MTYNKNDELPSFTSIADLRTSEWQLFTKTLKEMGATQTIISGMYYNPRGDMLDGCVNLTQHYLIQYQIKPFISNVTVSKVRLLLKQILHI